MNECAAVIACASAVEITLVVCVPLAYGLTKISGRARAVDSYRVLAKRLIPYVVLALPMFLIFVNIGLSGSRTGLLLAHLSIHIPFATWMLVGFFDTVPHELEEAGIVDGCPPWNLFWNVSLPVVRSGVIASDQWQSMPHLLDRFRLAQIARQDAGREGDLVFASTPITKCVHARGQFRVDRLFDQLAHPVAKDVGEWVG